MTTPSLSDRDLRQRAMVPPDALAVCRATVVGVGAIGRQVALQLAALGVPQLQLVDDDSVEVVNLAVQGYFVEDLSKLKVEATAEVCRRLNPATAVSVAPERFRRSLQGIGNAVFCCVDAIETRRLIWEAVGDRVQFFADGRMSAEVLRVLVAADAAGKRHYPQTLFAAGEAWRGACTSRSTIYCSNIAAGVMVSQFTKWLRRLPLELEITLNLLAAEWSSVPTT